MRLYGQLRADLEQCGFRDVEFVELICGVPFNIENDLLNIPDVVKIHARLGGIIIHQEFSKDIMRNKKGRALIAGSLFEMASNLVKDEGIKGVKYT